MLNIALLNLDDKTMVDPELVAAMTAASLAPSVISGSELAALPEVDGYLIVGQSRITATTVDLAALDQANRVGKPILGIGGGAELLIQSGLAPGILNNVAVIDIDMLTEESFGSHLVLAPHYQRNAFTYFLQQQDALTISKAVDPRVSVIILPGLLQEIEHNGLDVWHYASTAASMPTAHIAALSNKAGNVCAILPELQYQTTFQILLQSMAAFIREARFKPVAPLHYQPRGMFL